MNEDKSSVVNHIFQEILLDSSARPNKALFTVDLCLQIVKTVENIFFPETKTKMSCLCEIMQYPTELGASEMDGHECAFCHPGKGA